MRRNLAGVGGADSPQEWFHSLPINTKFLLTSGILIGAAVSFNISSAATFAFVWPLVWHKFQIWRFFSCFIFAGSFSFNFLMHMYMLYQNSLRYEMNPFNTGAGGTSADYLWFLLFGMTVLCIIGYIFEIAFLAEPFLYMIMYVGCRREPQAIFNIFGFKIGALYLPWFYVALRLLMGGDIVLILIGIAVGHFYYFLVDVLPNTHGINLIKTPNFCIDFVQYITGMTQPRFSGVNIQEGGGYPRADNPPQTRGGYSWGRGRPLGGAD